MFSHDYWFLHIFTRLPIFTTVQLRFHMSTYVYHCLHMWLDLRPVSFYSLRCLLFLVNTALCMTCLLHYHFYCVHYVYCVYHVFCVYHVHCHINMVNTLNTDKHRLFICVYHVYCDGKHSITVFTVFTVFICVYLCLLVFTMFTMFTIFTCVYLCLPVFTVFTVFLLFVA